jgi:pimeloyl-ACP methyl ester carboxylesterase
MPELVVDGIQYSYFEVGAGPLLLFAHGTFGVKESFTRQMEDLAPRYRCVSIDLPGHGGSSYDPKGWTIDDLVHAVPALIAALGERQAALAGVSQGGAVFMRAALMYPGKVLALIIMCAGATTPPPELMKRLREFAAVLHNGDEATREHYARQFLSTFHAPVLVEAGDAGIEQELTQVLKHSRQAMPLVAEVPASYRSVFDQLMQIACPTLIIWGDRDFRPLLGGEIAAQIPHAQLRVIRSAGHHVHIDAPAETARAIGDFLDSRLTAT